MSFRRKAIMLAGFAALSAFGAPSVMGCATLERAARKDPVKCERDPTCANKRGRATDCDTQCASDPVCIERCREIEIGAGTSGR
ncbi:MAG: hypothetical protein U0174_12515 [Polyangiaceae bacterium]